jgi:plasmid replication initiation protein
MTEHLMKEVITIGSAKDDRWIKFHWVDVCEYDNGKLTVKLSDELKPFLIGLRGSFTKYQLSDIIGFNSMYAIRIYEVFSVYINEYNPHADVSVEISISIEELRRITDTTDKFERYSSFKTKVIDTALKEINAKSKYHVTATPYKDGRAIAGYDFLIESEAGYQIRKQDQQTVEKQLDGQMNLLDYQDTDGQIRIH